MYEFTVTGSWLNTEQCKEFAASCSSGMMQEVFIDSIIVNLMNDLYTKL